MADPFYTQNKFQQNPQTAGQNPLQQGQVAANNQQVANQQVPQQAPRLTQQQMQQLLQQEQAIIQQRQQLDQMLKTQQLAPQQQQAVAKQMQQYQQQLQYIAYQKQQFGMPVAQGVQHPKVKKGKKMNMKKFLIGCGVFLIILIGGAALMFSTFINDPDRLASMGMNMETGKQLLQALTSIFFGLLVFLGFGLFVSNIYRIFTVKNKSKIGFVFGTLLGLIIFGGSIALWINILDKVGDIVPSSGYNSQDIVVSYAQFKDGPYLIQDEMPLIGPIATIHTLNGQAFNTQILPSLGQVDTNQLEINLDCGNGSSIPVNLQNLQFEGICLYSDKGNYKLSLDINYFNIQTQEKLQKTVEAGNIVVSSAITITPSGNKISYNDSMSEIILGEVPRKVTFDASSIFSDFGLTTYEISWDVNGDGEYDRENDSAFSYSYKNAQVYNVVFKIPGLGDYLYTFPVRVEQSDVPICEVNTTLLKGTEYIIQTDFIEKNAEITDYIYSVIDINSKKTLDTINNQGDSMKYQFPGAGTYAVRVVFQTDEGDQGQCESDNIQLGASDFEIYYDLLYKSPSSPSFEEIPEDMIDADGNITISEIPTVLQLKINKIVPDNASATQKVYLNNEPQLSLDENIIEMTIENNQDQEIKIVVEDVNRDMKSEKIIRVSVDREDIIGRLLVSPDSVGIDPFTVKFDASTSDVNDKEDEIVYFTRDFGDGEIKKNVSQAVMVHTYNYDYENEVGTFNPTLVLTTKKGREVTVELDQPIIVKKQQKTFTINIDSHPGQIAKVGDRVSFSLSLDGSPETILRDFGNGNTMECDGRECVEMTQIYSEPGTYKIKVTIYDSQNTETESFVNLKVQ